MPASQLRYEELLMFDRAITLFGRTPVDASHFDATVDGFQNFLTSTGIQHFSAREMVTPNHKDIARRLGYDEFLPEQAWWDRGAALAACADVLREAVGEPVRMRNWWRPRDYNSEVGGAAGSDHVTAHGVDLDYRSADSRRIAEAQLREWQRDEDWLEMSLGLGGRTTHVGIGSPRGRRDWTYDSYSP